MTEQPVQWWLVRHAPTINPEKVVYGSLDLDIETPSAPVFDALSDLLPADPAWMVSNLSRTRKTLQGILDSRGILAAEIHEEPHFAEQHFGEWEGRPSADVWAEIREEEKTWPADIRPPGGETFSEVAARVRGAALDWTEKIGERPIVAIIHSGSIRGFLATAMGDAPLEALTYSVETLSVTRCDCFGPDRWRVGFVNRLAT